MTEPAGGAPGGGAPPARRAELRVWDDATCRRVHAATCEVLAETGVEARHPRALELLRQAGAEVSDTR
nr:trimethylamine methyltransferase family protein [Thermoleophilia bacterium]